MAKLLVALAIAVAGWWLWKGPKSSWTDGKRPVDPYAALPPDMRSAFRTLGLNPGASEKDIRAAHRRLLIEAHPDHGGSPERAGAINTARDTLLKRDD